MILHVVLFIVGFFFFIVGTMFLISIDKEFMNKAVYQRQVAIFGARQMRWGTGCAFFALSVCYIIAGFCFGLVILR